MEMASRLRTRLLALWNTNHPLVCGATWCAGWLTAAFLMQGQLWASDIGAALVGGAVTVVCRIVWPRIP